VGLGTTSASSTPPSTPSPAAPPTTAFHDVTTGDNSVFWPTRLFTGYQAGPGWDPVTGWGSPNAQTLVPLLAHDAGPGGAVHS
jgi:hypothetical protein